jgi:glycosyltransferase involved in cell wall biosynthesis
MKILVLNYEYPPLGGGAGVITKHISEGLAELGHDVIVITTLFKGLDKYEEQGNLKIIRLKAKRKFTYRSSVMEMRSWIRMSKSFLTKYFLENTADICIANFALPGGEVALYLKKRFALPYVIISHGHDIPWYCREEMFKYHVVTYPWIKKICMVSVANFVQTADMKENIDKFLGPKNVYKNLIIPNGCDTELFHSNTSRLSSEFKIIFSCRLVKQKDPFTFLKALQLLNDKKIKFFANIVGDGVLKNEMIAYVRENNLEDKIKFLGWISKEEIVSEYQSSHVFVQSSIHEAMSIAVMEAMACGTYVIATPVGMNKELIKIGETGDLFSLGNAEELADKLLNFYNEKFLVSKTVEDSLLSQFRKNFNWNNIVLKYDSALKALVKKN